MNKCMLLGGAAAMAVATAASADLVGVSVMNLGDLGAGGESWRVMVEFDAMDDVLLAVGGIAGGPALSFSSSAPLIQNNTLDGLLLGDTAQFDLGGDSWLSIGLDNPQDTNFSPGFAGGDGVNSVVNGTGFFEADGGYFDSNPTSVEGGVGMMAIAQFTLPAGAEATFSGLVNWRDDTLPSGEFNSSEFLVVIPTPGAIALLGVAGLVGRRRRG